MTVIAAVWKAIEDNLYRYGDADVRAGLAWLTDDQQMRIARAAIAALREPTEGMIDPDNLPPLKTQEVMDSHWYRRRWQAMIDAALAESDSGLK